VELLKEAVQIGKLLHTTGVRLEEVIVVPGIVRVGGPKYEGEAAVNGNSSWNSLSESSHSRSHWLLIRGSRQQTA
jgi:hypothetical protein